MEPQSGPEKSDLDGSGAVSPGRDSPPAIRVECVETLALEAYATAWTDLCARALEPNVYLEPAFLLSLLQHAGAGRRLNFLLVWEENGPTDFGRLLGLFPVERPRWLTIGGVGRGLSHEQTSCGTPLVDRACEGMVFEAALSWLATHWPLLNALAFKGVVENGAFHEALARFCTGSSRRLRELDAHQRAVLRRRGDGDAALLCFPSTKRRKEHARQVRRLAEAGTRVFASARTPDEIATATDRFLALEHRGWKGARGTALLSDPHVATFVRTMTDRMARQGMCRIDSLDVEGKPVAMGIILKTGDRSYFWKTAFDEAYAVLSPGVQFAVELTRAQLGDRTSALTDSCAIADHPMIDKVWPDRMGITDVVLAVRPAAAIRFAYSFRIEVSRRAARRVVKAFWHRLRRRGG